MSWIGRLLGRKRLEDSLDRELQFHLDSRVEDLQRAGISPVEAMRRARLELGGVEQVKERARDARGTRFVEEWWSDTRYAFRAMSRAPTFTAAVVVTLALGIGATTAVWSLIDALLIRSLPVERPEDLYALRRVGNEDGTYRVSYPMLKRLRAAAPTGVQLSGMSAAARMYASTRAQPEGVIAQLVSGDWFSLLGVRPVAGRLLTRADDETLGNHPVAVVSDWYVQRRLGGDRSIVGKTIRLNGAAFTIIGVTEPGFTGLSVGTAIDIWIPTQMQHVVRYASNASTWNADNRQPWVPQDGIAWLTVVTRMSADAARAAAEPLDRTFRLAVQDQSATLDSAVAAYAMREHLVPEPFARGFSPLRQEYADSLKALLASVAMLLLIACGNVAGLLMARSSARNHELAVRVSLGARPGRLVRQLLTESLTLALIGGAAGVLVAKWGSHTLLRLASGSGAAIPLSVPVDAKMLLFALGASLLTGFLFGLAPAIRVHGTRLHDAFKAGGRVLGRAGHRLPLGRILVVVQLALSLLLMMTAGLFVQTFQNLVGIDAGYERERVLSARIDLPAVGYTSDRLSSLQQRLLDAVRAVPGVQSASLSLTGLAGGSMRISGFAVPGRVLPAGDNNGQENVVTPEFFETVGISLIAGRPFRDADRFGAPRVAIISEATAKHFFGTMDVLGARFGYGSPPEFEVVGLVRDARVNNIRETPKRLIFYPLAQRPDEYVTSVEVRTAQRAEAIAPAVKAAIASVDASIPVREITTLGNLLERGLIRERLVARLGSAFGIVALLLAGIGLYGVISYSVSRRTNEMGVRLALGASPGRVAAGVLRDALLTVAIGLAFGALLSLPAMEFVEKLVWGISPHDSRTLVGAITALLAVGGVAGLIPALRAARVDPVEAIRAE